MLSAKIKEIQMGIIFVFHTIVALLDRTYAAVSVII